MVSRLSRDTCAIICLDVSHITLITIQLSEYILNIVGSCYRGKDAGE